MEVTNVAAIIWIIAILNVALGTFVYSAGKTRISRAFLVAAFSHAVWQVIVGLFISATTPEGATLLVKLAYLAGIMVSCAFSFFFIIYPQNKDKKFLLKSVLGLAILVFAWLNLGTDLIIAKAHYLGGISHWGWDFGSLWYIFPILFFGTFFFGFGMLLWNGLRAEDSRVRRSSLLIFWGVAILVTVPTILNIILPQMGIFTYLWLGPILNTLWIGFIGYAILKYEALNVRLIAKRAFIYGGVVVVIGLLNLGINWLNSNITTKYPTFPLWVSYLFSAMIIASLGYLVWLKLRENDVLKYEFITIATHKFRTPLTYIKWATENLEKAVTPEERQNQLDHIRQANAKLVELTDVLANLSDTQDETYEYHRQRTDIGAAMEEVLESLTSQTKSFHINKNIHRELYAVCDPSRIKFILQTLIENSTHYTPSEGTITISTQRVGREIICSVQDTGIGISRDELPFIFTKFYRGAKARVTDTEGMGIGLFISKDIIAREGGRIWVESEGYGKGSKFLFALPAKN